MKTTILNLTSSYIDFELYYKISIWRNEIHLFADFNHKTAKEMLRLNYSFINKQNANDEEDAQYIFLKQYDSYKIKVFLTEGLSADESTIAKQLLNQFM